MKYLLFFIAALAFIVNLSASIYAILQDDVIMYLIASFLAAANLSVLCVKIVRSIQA
jgi:hypothetical protein